MALRAGDTLAQIAFQLVSSWYQTLVDSQARTLSGEVPFLFGSAHLNGFGFGLFAELARVMECHLFLLTEREMLALARAEEAEQFRSTIFGHSFVTDIPLYLGLAAAKCLAGTEDPIEQERLRGLLSQGIERFEYFSAGCAANFQHKLRLLQAESARVHGRTKEAMRLYDQAISLAHAEGFLYIEALAAKYCADFHRQEGRLRFADLYLHDAYDAYRRWGACAVLTFLQKTYPQLSSPLLPTVAATTIPATRSPGTSASTSSARSTGAQGFDAQTAFLACQALSSELQSNRVILELMQLVQQNAGAQRAALLLASAQGVEVAAVLTDEAVASGEPEPLAARHPVAQTVVQYVLRTGESVVLSEPAQDGRFAGDTRWAQAAVRSILAVPLVQKGRVGGVLYLEHDLPSAFSAARVALLGVLAAQTAVALENARLYADLQAVNASLEAKVHQRTAALDKALKELWTEMDLAQKIQTVLLPSDPRIVGYELAAVMRPADQVGGDYYDVFRQGEQDWVLIGDVSGHGVPAGLCMMMIQAVLRAVALTLKRSHAPLTPRRLLGLVNEAVESNLKQIGLGKYMTITALCLQGDTVRYAGLHQDLLIYRAARHQVERVETQGIWLGVADGDISEMLQDDELRLDAGDVLLLYTDGYTEAKVAGHLLGTQGLAERLADLCGQALPSAALLEGLLHPLQQAEVSDDVTLVALRRLSVPMEDVGAISGPEAFPS